jgi:hypothetical protein
LGTVQNRRVKVPSLFPASSMLRSPVMLLEVLYYTAGVSNQLKEKMSHKIISNPGSFLKSNLLGPILPKKKLII